jgi:hypothetical protein
MCHISWAITLQILNTYMKIMPMAHVLIRLVYLQVPACFNHVGLRFSTTVPNDPDSHADFQQNNKGRSGSFSGISFMEDVEKVYMSA